MFSFGIGSQKMLSLSGIERAKSSINMFDRGFPGSFKCLFTISDFRFLPSRFTFARFRNCVAQWILRIAEPHRHISIIFYYHVVF